MGSPNVRFIVNYPTQAQIVPLKGTSKNYLRCHRGVKNRLVRESELGAPIKMLIYNT